MSEASAGRELSLAIVGAYPTDPSIIRNGVEAVVVYLVEALRRMPGLQVQVVTTTDSVQGETAVDKEGVTIHYLPSIRRFRNITFDAITKMRLRRKIDALGPDIVHVHNHMATPYFGFTTAPCPVVTTIHGLVFEEMKYEVAPKDWLRRGPRTALERIVLRQSRELIAVSEYVRGAIQPMTNARVTVIENPVAEAFYAIGADRSRAEPVALRPRVLSAGAIMRRKNVLDLLRAVAIVSHDCPGVELRIAGGVQDQVYYESLQRYVHEKELHGSVRFLGQLSEPQLLAEYARASLVASASHEETAGMVFQQGMAAGLPSLGTRVGGVPFIVKHEETGLLVAPGNVEQLAAGLRIMLESPELRARMGEAGRTAALRRFTLEVVAARTMELYEQMVFPSVQKARAYPL